MRLEGQPNVLPALAAGAEVAFVCDDRNAIVDASLTMSRLLGRGVEAMRGEQLVQLAVQDDEDEVLRGLAEARRTGASTFSVRLRVLGGPPLRATISACSIGGEGPSRTLCLVASPPDRKRRAEERAERLADTQRTIATILALALEEIPVDDLLRRTLDLILSIPWLSIERKGAVFLVEPPGTLVMKVHRGLNPSLVSSCSRVAFDSCLCGQAAMDRKPVYASDLDARHTVRYPGIVAHGHYCVPICSDDATLGVITTYLAPGHERSDVEVEFLTAVANTLAGVLIRRRADARRHEAERASRAKSEFLALVSHELLTPVTAVLLGCKRLERDRAMPLAPRHAQILFRMEDALTRLGSTVRLLLEYARLDSGAPPIRDAPVDVAEVAARVVAEVRPLAERKGLPVRLEVSTPLPFLCTDERLLQLVLANLASNAVKFTQQGAVVIKAGYHDGVHWMAIEDTGPGIPASERARIFEPFEPLAPLANKHAPGMGLGLALSRRLAHALGGRLELESVHGLGSTFVLMLPHPAEETDGGQVPAPS